jgi:hypothetical protein
MIAAEAARVAAFHLQGTCKSIADLGPEFEALQDDMEFCMQLDALIFCCEGCEWWHEQSEMAEDAEGFCEDCA